MDSESQSERPTTAENGASGSQGAHTAESDFPGHSTDAQPPGQAQRTGPARHHGGAKQQGRQNAPQYKLLAKITGLERVGKKDPVLRFDVHVSRS